MADGKGGVKTGKMGKQNASTMSVSEAKSINSEKKASPAISSGSGKSSSKGFMNGKKK